MKITFYEKFRSLPTYTANTRTPSLIKLILFLLNLFLTLIIPLLNPTQIISPSTTPISWSSALCILPFSILLLIMSYPLNLLMPYGLLSALCLPPRLRPKNFTFASNSPTLLKVTSQLLITSARCVPSLTHSSSPIIFFSTKR